MNSLPPVPQQESPQPADEAEGSGPPYRAIAMVLLVAVAVAVVIGLVQLFGGKNDSDGGAPAASEQSTAQSAPATGGNAPAPAEGGSASGAAPGQPGANGENAPAGSPEAGAPAASPAPGAPAAAGGQPADLSAVPVQIFNNSNVVGLAGRTGDTLRGSGFNVNNVTNLPSSQGVVPESAAYYGTGAGEQQAAEAIAAQLGIKALPRPAGFEVNTPGVVLIVTQDLQR